MLFKPWAQGLFAACLWLGQATQAEEYFDAGNMPTKGKLLEIMKIPTQAAQGGTRNISIRPKPNGTAQAPGMEKRFFAINIPFESNSDELTEEARQLLSLIGDAMKELPGQSFIVEGHTDSKGGHQRNYELSKLRAKSARSFLVEEVGIDHKKITAEGKGESEPIIPSNPEDGRNRSVRIVTYRQ